MKKLVAILLAVAMVACLFVGCSGTNTTTTTAAQADTTAAQADTTATPEETTEAAPAVDTSAWHVAMITDYGDITDESFNQTTYEAGKAWCESMGVDFTYYKPTDDSTEARVASIDQAVADGYNVLLMPGFAFAGAIVETAETYPDVYYIALDVGEYDLQDAAGTVDDWSYVYPANVFSAVYQEELAGYMAGYAAVKLGYTELGFLGGMAVPAVVRYGYGFVQGADAAAAETGATVNMKYVYGNQFFGDADITAYMDTWYAAGTQCVFACGGGIYTSAAEAAAKVDGAKVIGVDVDQAAIIDAYGEGMTVTSAMKGLGATVNTLLEELIVNDNWAEYSGKVTTLGLVSADDPTLNYVQLPLESTQWADGFTQDDYVALVGQMFDGTIAVSNDTESEPAVTTITVDYQGNIK
ncbi:MAG: BMP family protein [Faecousia sp.]